MRYNNNGSIYSNVIPLDLKALASKHFTLLEAYPVFHSLFETSPYRFITFF